MIGQLKRLIPERHPVRLLWHRLKAFFAALRYGFPARKLVVIGITGTDGKTTTVMMTHRILIHSGIAAGALSTASLAVRENIEGNTAEKTSPSPFVVQQFLHRLVREGCTHIVLEYSSHGLVQSRLAWTWPVVAAITNTAEEHLDYHGSMEQYRRDKGILFRMLNGKGTKVLNADDGTFAMYREIPSERTIEYSGQRTTDSGLRETNVSLWLSGTSITSAGSSALLQMRTSEVRGPRSEVLSSTLSIPLLGFFNLSNALCAISCATALGIPLDTCCEALKTFRGIPGRLERIDEGQPFSVFVDFTVTPQAFRATLTTVRQLLQPGQRLLVLTGSCGNRMREKRPVIGRLCSELADVIVLTDDEPYTEDPQRIIDDIRAGVLPGKGEVHTMLDRREAIAFTLRQARPGDAVLLCGMGSYPIRVTAAGPIPWNEQKIVRGMLKNR